jgi:hypothetical protein
MYTGPIPIQRVSENSVVGSMRKGGAMCRKQKSRGGGVV